MKTAREIHARYEAVRHRLPVGAATGAARAVDSLMDITDGMDAFVFDAFGVLNVGETPIDGAAARLDALRARGCAIRILTNAASYDRAGAVDKFRRLGMRVADDEIVTSRDATLRHLPARRWGVIAAAADMLTDIPAPSTRLCEDRAAYDAAEGFLFLSAADWTDARQAMLEASLTRAPRPVFIANADLAAPRDDGFSREPGYFGHRIADLTAAEVRFFGKPFAEVYALAEATLPGVSAQRIAMCGDTLHTDILGAAARGWRTVLVTRDGLYAGLDASAFAAEAGILPDWHLARI
jgi:HAD superfamily hydrolase (TIGR01450 family)